MMPNLGSHLYVQLLSEFQRDPDWAKSIWDERTDEQAVRNKLAGRGFEHDDLVALLHVQAENNPADEAWKALANLADHVLQAPGEESYRFIN